MDLMPDRLQAVFYTHTEGGILIRYFSMFSGIGGFDLALNRNGHKGVAYSEIDKYAIQTYKKNFGEEIKNYGNAKDIDTNELPDFDLLCGGFPCQAFSIAGKRGGFKDTRGTLFYEIARIAKAKKPTYLFLENVKGLLSHDKGETYFKIRQILWELGYECERITANSRYFGGGNKRTRVFILGFPPGENKSRLLSLCNMQEVDRTEAEKLDAANTLVSCYWKGPASSRPIIKYPCSKYRLLTPLECERIHRYPEGWTDGVSKTQRYKQLGNSVDVGVVQAIAERF